MGLRSRIKAINRKYPLSISTGIGLFITMFQNEIIEFRKYILFYASTILFFIGLKLFITYSITKVIEIGQLLFACYAITYIAMKMMRKIWGDIQKARMEVYQAKRIAKMLGVPLPIPREYLVIYGSTD